MSNSFDLLTTALNELRTLREISALLDWDQNINLPPRAGPDRADQIEYLATLVHNKVTDPRLLEAAQNCLKKCADNELSVDQSLVVKELIRSIKQEIRLPARFVAERARAASETFQVWQSAKAAGDWQAVEPHLERLVSLYREEGHLRADGKSATTSAAYNALLDVHERGATVELLTPLFLRLADKLSGLVKVLSERSSAPLGLSLDVSAQDRLSRKLATMIGYDFSRGALHQAEHPFMTSLGAHDYRISTHYYQDAPLSSVYSTLHEAGHAIYEQGLPTEWVGTARGSTISLGVHESQSRFWENMVGRSRAFIPQLSGLLKAEGLDVDPERLWLESNRVTPSLIRIEADEVTYALHVVIRMLLESDLIADKLKVADLPEAWNAAYQKYLGITPTGHTTGVLQDVHWYCGLIGYFPTYTLGNLYGGMLRQGFEREHGKLDNVIAKGDFAFIVNWLKQNVHTHGMLYGAQELMERVAQTPLSEQPFFDYLYEKFDLEAPLPQS